MSDNTELLFDQAYGQLKTVRDFLRFGISLFNRKQLFYGHGTTNVYDEVVYLILHSLHLPLDVLEPYLDAVVLSTESQLILERFRRRAIDGVPAPYITKEAILQGYSFYVDERVIIPRSFIPEILVTGGLDQWIEYPELVHDVLDLCTGNGSIAVVAGDYFPDADIVAADISSDALEVAAINIERYALQERIELVQSDLWQNLEGRKFDLILTNPPYVDTLRMDSLPGEYRFEPALALAGGDDGLELVDRILQNAANHLTDFGLLVVEMGDNRNQLEQKYPDLPFTWLDTVSGDGFVFILKKHDLVASFGEI